MSRLRLLLAWLLMAALPLQGFAAASMLFCGNESQHAHAQALTVGASGADEAWSGLHGAGQHDRAGHQHASSKHPQHGEKSAHSMPDATHKCSVCAACCNCVALVSTAHALALAPAPQADLAEPFVHINARPSPVPDKPPRA
jgi:hypothetical protein